MVRERDGRRENGARHIHKMSELGRMMEWVRDDKT